MQELVDAWMKSSDVSALTNEMVHQYWKLPIIPLERNAVPSWMTCRRNFKIEFYVFRNGISAMMMMS
jgi:hypothetical protein